MLATYYRLAKPGIICGNTLTTAGAFFLASKGHPDFGLFFTMLAGLSLIVASGCVFNNVIDRDIDARMERTKKRAMAAGIIGKRAALAYAATLGILGTFALFFFTNHYSLGAALAGLFIYVIVYSLWAKRGTEYGTAIGAIAGAVPPVVGYTAVTGEIDAGAILLFTILALWQMPHALAIAIYRLRDYAKAKIPVLPVAKGIRRTQLHMATYIIAFSITAFMLTLTGHTGYIYLVTMALLCGRWFQLCLSGFNASDPTRWGKKMFLFSLVVITAFSILISLEGFI